MSELPAGFRCSSDMSWHLEKVFDGEYDVPGFVPPDGLRVIDVGANCGAFVIWAANKWPGCNIVAYEPCEQNFQYLVDNVAPGKVGSILPEEVIMSGPNGTVVRSVRAAVAATDKAYGYLRMGASNIGECSLHLDMATLPQGESVRMSNVNDMPACHFLKLDCEGSELDILKHYQHLGSVQALALEWHRKPEIPAIISLTSAVGLRLVNTVSDGRVFHFLREKT